MSLLLAAGPGATIGMDSGTQTGSGCDSGTDECLAYDEYRELVEIVGGPCIEDIIFNSVTEVLVPPFDHDYYSLLRQCLRREWRLSLPKPHSDNIRNKMSCCAPSSFTLSNRKSMFSKSGYLPKRIRLKRKSK